VEKYEYFSGTPEVGIVPRAPHAGPLLRHVFEQEQEVGIMADFANPTRVSEFALGLSRPDYMSAWAGYTTDPRFTFAPGRLAEARALGERLADARDTLRPPEDEGRA